MTEHHHGIPQPAGLHPHEIDRLGRRRPVDEDHLLRARTAPGTHDAGTGLTPHLVRGRFGEGRECGQTPLRRRRHDPGRGGDSINCGGHFGVEAVGQPSHAEHEDEPDSDDGDQELPGSEPQVRKCDRQHASTHSRHPQGCGTLPLRALKRSCSVPDARVGYQPKCRSRNSLWLSSRPLSLRLNLSQPCSGFLRA